jgi:hypothetical protein
MQIVVSFLEQIHEGGSCQFQQVSQIVPVKNR